MDWANIHRDILIRLYVDEEKSTYEIAEELNTYPNKIVRALKKLQIPTRDRSEAQSSAIKTGRHEHPTEGKVRSEQTKIKISESVHDGWKNISEEDYEKRVKKAKKAYKSKTKAEKKMLSQSCSEGLRKSSKEGSKLERFLLSALRDAGLTVHFHKCGLILNNRLEVDLFLPILKIAIEVDGPAHFLPLWGEENLQKHISADARKAGLLINAGIVLIRIKSLVKTLSHKHKRDILSELLLAVKKIEGEFPDELHRYIELEVK